MRAPANGKFKCQLVDPTHQQQIGIGHRARQVVHVRARQIQQLGLPRYG